MFSVDCELDRVCNYLVDQPQDHPRGMILTRLIIVRRTNLRVACTVFLDWVLDCIKKRRWVGKKA